MRKPTNKSAAKKRVVKKKRATASKMKPKVKSRASGAAKKGRANSGVSFKKAPTSKSKKKY